MSWIKIRTNLATDPAVAAIGIATKMHPRQVVGCLVAVWCWADPLTADGFISHATEKLIDDVSGKRGFASAMVGVQWLCLESNGVRFPNWDRHHSQSAKARAGESERKRISRMDSSKSGHDSLKMSGQTSGHFTEQCPDQIREEEIREDSKKYIPPVPVGMGDGLLNLGDDPPNPKSQESKAPEKTERKSNPLFDALAFETDGDPSKLTQQTARAVGVALSAIKRVCEDLSPQEITRRANNYRLHFRDATLTASALSKHWARCDSEPMGRGNRMPNGALMR